MVKALTVAAGFPPKADRPRPVEAAPKLSPVELVVAGFAAPNENPAVCCCFVVVAAPNAGVAVAEDPNNPDEPPKANPDAAAIFQLVSEERGQHEAAPNRGMNAAKQ